MKKLFILHVLLCFWLWNYAQSYEDYSKISKIGYSTNYSNGQFNSGVYKSSMTTLEYQNRAFTGTYNPSSGGSRPGGQPKRVRGYNEDGDETDLPPDTWNGKDTMYYGWDRNHSNHRYFIYLNGAVYWWSPGTFFYKKGWQTSGYSDLDEFFRNNRDGYDTYYKDPPTPIDDTITPLFLLLILYLVIKKKNLSRENC